MVDGYLFIQDFFEDFKGRHGIHDDTPEHYRFIAGRGGQVECGAGNKTPAGLSLQSLQQFVDFVQARCGFGFPPRESVLTLWDEDGK